MIPSKRCVACCKADVETRESVVVEYCGKLTVKIIDLNGDVIEKTKQIMDTYNIGEDILNRMKYYKLTMTFTEK